MAAGRMVNPETRTGKKRSGKGHERRGNLTFLHDATLKFLLYMGTRTLFRNSVLVFCPFYRIMNEGNGKGIRLKKKRE